MLIKLFTRLILKFFFTTGEGRKKCSGMLLKSNWVSWIASWMYFFRFVLFAAHHEAMPLSLKRILQQMECSDFLCIRAENDETNRLSAPQIKNIIFHLIRHIESLFGFRCEANWKALRPLMNAISSRWMEMQIELKSPKCLCKYLALTVRVHYEYYRCIIQPEMFGFEACKSFFSSFDSQ